jgi:septum site-determining protein MinD
MGEVIVITSGKGGVGKTTITANLSIAISKMGKSVIAIDTDIGLRNLDVVMGLENNIVYNLVDVIEGNCRLKQAIIKDRRHNNLYLLPSAQAKDKNAITPQQMIELTNRLKTQFDYVLIDCPAGIEQGFQNAIAGATTAIVVTTPEVSAIRDADRIIGLLEKDGISPIHLLVNKLRPELIRRGDMMSGNDVFEILGTEIIGCVNDDVNVVIATNRGEAIVDQANNSTGKAIINIASRLLGRNVEDETKESRFSILFFRNIFSKGVTK